MSPRPSVLTRALPILVVVVALAGCSSAQDATSEFVGFGVGAAVGAATGNPLLAVAAGLATRIATNEGVAYYHREQQRVVQDAIAEVAGRTPVGEMRPWSADSDVPLVGAEGRVQVVREFGGEIRCREIVFTDDDDPGEVFVAVICKGADRWTWAVSEPSTKRWGNLQ